MRVRWWPVAMLGAALVLVVVAGLIVLNRGGPGGSVASPARPEDRPTPGSVTPPEGSPSPDGSPSSSAAASPGPSPASPRPGASTPPGASSGVFFQDVGDVKRWSNYPQRPQKSGIIRTVTSPSFKGGTSIEAQQTYVNEGGGYHSETILARAQRVGEDRYFGQAIYLAPDWQFHNQSVTFQQFSPEDPEGPWLLMILENDQIRLGGSAGIGGVIGKITNLRGTWIRLVIRLKLAPTAGAVEVWLNGTKTVSKTNRPVLPKTANSIRWSSGIYCNSWRTDLPVGPHVLSVFHSHARLASSYELAEPANW
jgi:hypothetical protein